MQTNSVSQAAMAPYSLGAFNALPEFEESKGRLHAMHNVFDRFGEIVRKHHVHAFLGASLIHKHFPLYAGERIVEEVRPDGTLLSPNREIGEDELTPYMCT
jgi:hypothetical protein